MALKPQQQQNQMRRESSSEIINPEDRKQAMRESLHAHETCRAGHGSAGALPQTTRNGPGQSVPDDCVGGIDRHAIGGSQPVRAAARSLPPRCMADPKTHPDQEGDLALEEEPASVAPPPMYKVVMLNDDFTPMEFVIEVLVRYFGMAQDRATATMLEVHNRGRAVCGVFTREVAETKVMQVNDLARQNQHPLLCMMEEA